MLIEPRKEGVVWDAGPLCRFGNRNPIFAELYRPGAATIPYLLKCSCPSAIVRFVIAVRILALYRMLRAWPLAHIRKKALESG